MSRYSVTWFIFNYIRENIFHFLKKTCIINYCLCGIYKYLILEYPSYVEWYLFVHR
jgi:hypothetical protein